MMHINLVTVSTPIVIIVKVNFRWLLFQLPVPISIQCNSLSISVFSAIHFEFQLTFIWTTAGLSYQPPAAAAAQAWEGNRRQQQSSWIRGSRHRQPPEEASPPTSSRWFPFLVLLVSSSWRSKRAFAGAMRGSIRGGDRCPRWRQSC